MREKPNVLLLSIDSLRADEVSFLNEDRDTTPNIDRLAGQSAVFSRAITPSVWTLPVHASVFTGQYPPEHNVLDFQRQLGEDPTLGQELNRRGYHTRAFFTNSWLDMGGFLSGFDEKDDASEVDPDTAGWKEHVANALKYAGIDKPAYHLYEYFNRPQDDTETVENFFSFLDAPEEPFFSFVHLNDAHWKYFPPKSVEASFAESTRLKRNWTHLYWQYDIYGNKAKYWRDGTDAKEYVNDTLRDLYRTCISHVDTVVGNMIEQLQKKDLMEDTIIIIFGDHGDNFGENGMYGHHFSVAEGLIRVPLVVYDPTETLPTRRHDNPVQLNDLFPTLLSLCDITPPKTNSVDLTTAERESAFVYYQLPDPSHVDEFLDAESRGNIPPRKQFAVWRSEDEKTVWYPDEGSFEGPRPLFEELRSHYQSLDTTEEIIDREISKSTEERLERLGYM